MPETGRAARPPSGSQWVNLGGPSITTDQLIEREEAYLQYVLALYG
jgi:hypothetical protein